MTKLVAGVGSQVEVFVCEDGVTWDSPTWFRGGKYALCSCVCFLGGEKVKRKEKEELSSNPSTTTHFIPL